MTTGAAPKMRAVTVPESDKGIQWSLSPTEGIPSKGRRDPLIGTRGGANDFVDVNKIVLRVSKASAGAGLDWRCRTWEQREIEPRTGDVAAAKALGLSLTYGGLDAFLMNGAGPQRPKARLRLPEGEASRPHGRRGTARRPSVRERCLGLRSRGSALGVGRPGPLNRQGIATSTPRPTGLEPVAFSHHRHPGGSRGPGAARITQDNHAA